MKIRSLFLLSAMAFILTGCANFIREEPAVIWDRVPETEKLLVDSLDIKDGTAELKLRYTALRQMFSIVNIRETKYRAQDELFEVPTGLVTLPFTFVYYVAAELLSLGAASEGTSAKPMFWSVEGLNPFQNVEGGMFTERESIREKKGSRTAQDDSQREPYDAVVAVQNGMAEVSFQEPNNKPGKSIELDVGEELLIRINLLEAAKVMPSAQATRVIVDCDVQPDPTKDAFEKSVTFDIPRSLAGKVYNAREVVAEIIEGENNSATPEEALRWEERREELFNQLEEMGFENEASTFRFYRK